MRRRMSRRRKRKRRILRERRESGSGCAIKLVVSTVHWLLRKKGTICRSINAWNTERIVCVKFFFFNTNPRIFFSCYYGPQICCERISLYKELNIIAFEIETKLILQQHKTIKIIIQNAFFEMFLDWISKLSSFQCHSMAFSISIV